MRSTSILVASALAPINRLQLSVPRWHAVSALTLLLLVLSTSAWADSLALMSGAGQTGLGGSASAQPVVVQVRNVDGVVVAGRTINWTTSNGFVLNSSSSVTDTAGLASVSFTYGNYGTTAIVAADPVGGTSAQALQTSAGNDSLTLISGGGQTGQIGETSARPLVVEVRDAAGSPVAGRSIGWSDLTPYTLVNAATSITDATGRASMGFRFKTAPPTLGGSSATIRASDPASSAMVDASALVLGFDGVVRIVSGGNQTAYVGANSAPLVVEVRTWDGVPMAGVTVTWTERLTTDFVALSSASTITDASGRTSITYQFVRSGVRGIIEAAVGPVSDDALFVGVFGADITLLTPNQLSGSASTPAPPMVVEVRGLDNQLSVGTTVNWTVVSGDAVIASPTSITDASGRTSMGVTFGTVGSPIQVTDPVTMATRGAFYSVNPTESIRTVSGWSQVGVARMPGAEPIVVEVLDANGAPIAGRVIAWSNNLSNPGSAVTFAAPSSMTDASGRASMTFTYNGVGRAQIEAANTVGFRSAFAFVRCFGLDTLTVLSGGNQSGLVNSRSTQPVVVELRDPSGQPVAGVTLDWNSNGGNAVFDAATSITDGSGRASMHFTYGPTASINGLEARDPSTQVRAEFFSVGTTADSFSLISGNGQTGLVNTAGAQPMVVEVRDAAGLPVIGRPVFWSVSVPAGAAIANAASSVTDASGRASMGFTYGASAISSVLVGNDSVTGQQIRFNMTARASANSGSIISGNGQSGLPGTAGPQPIVIQLRDASNSPLPGKAVTWTVVSGPATLGPVSTITDASGQASASFNFGATAGTSIIQAQGPDSGQLLQAAVTALGSNQALSSVSGDGQILVANVTSAPLVVVLKDFSNTPVAGATISWSTSSGTLASASTVTDASGQSSNTVTVTAEGSVTVTANSPLASAPIIFTLTGGLAELPNLTPQQQSIATAVDILCPALAAQGTLTPQQADLLARCQELAAAAQLNPGATANALQELLSDTGRAQASAAVAAVSAQFQNINTRLNTLRTGAPMPVSLSGLSFTGSGGVIPLASLMSALAGDEKSPQKAEGFSRWGFFASGNIGRGESDAERSSPAYDYDIEGITVGLDYRKRDDLVLGAALGFTRQDTELAGDQGNVEMSGWSLSSYGTYSFKDKWYVDSVLTWGRNRYEMNRRIAFTLPRPGGGSVSINQLATGKPDGELLSLALTFGGDFHKQALGISPYGQVLYSRTSFDGYQESLLAGAGGGLGLAVEPREVTGLTGVLGSRFTYTHSTDWGVVIPTASVEWTHEFKGDAEAITASFIFDPTHTLFSVAGTPTDSDYLRLSVGLSMVLARGRSGFFQYQWMAARDGQSQYNLSLGFRIEF